MRLAKAAKAAAWRAGSIRTSSLGTLNLFGSVDNMLKLILADNQAIFRAGIAKVLAVEDEMRIVAQAQTQEQMFMALEKFRPALLGIAEGFHGDFLAFLKASNKAKTRVVVLADTGESTQRYMAAGA